LLIDKVEDGIIGFFVGVWFVVVREVGVAFGEDVTADRDGDSLCARLVGGGVRCVVEGARVVGVYEGADVGCKLGASDGDKDGICVGVLVGKAEGLRVGSTEGNKVGKSVEGAEVGSGVGSSVGKGVGSAVG